MNKSTFVISICAQAKELENKGDLIAAWNLIVGELEGLNRLLPEEQAQVLLRAGSVASRAGYVDREVAKDWLTRSLLQFEQVGDSVGAAGACYALALNCRNLGTFEDAYVWLDAANERVGEGDIDLTCRIELLRGILKKDEGRWREALAIYEATFPLFESNGCHGLIARLYGERAIVRRKLATAENAPEQFDGALMDYTAASVNYELAGDHISAAGIKNNIAFLLFKLRRLTDALKAVDEAIKIYSALKDRQNLAQTKETKAQILLALNRPEDAEPVARQSVALLQVGGERALLIESLITLAVCLARLGRKQVAFETFQSAEDVASFIEYKEGIALISLAILEEIGDLDFEMRRSHHKRIFENLPNKKNEEIDLRHAECMAQTVEVFRSEIKGGVKDVKGSSFFFENFSLDEVVAAVERFCIERALEEGGGCLKEASRLLNVSTSNLNAKLKTKHKALKTKQTYGHYRGVKVGHIGVITMPDDSMMRAGVIEGDKLVVRKGLPAESGMPVVLRSRGKFFIGIYLVEKKGAVLAPCNEEYEDWFFDEGTFKVFGRIVGYIKQDEVGKPDAKIRALTIAA